LVLGTDGYFYGSTACEQTDCKSGGTLFKMNEAGQMTLLYTFCSLPNCADGSHPHDRLFQATNGNLYGTTFSGGANGDGTIFSISSTGAFTTIYSFCSLANCSDGAFPQGGLMESKDGHLYGTTEKGGANGEGTVFEISPKNKLRVLHSFCSESKCADGSHPWSALVQGSNGDFFGTTVVGGTHNQGTVFEITPGGTLTTLYSFCSETGCADGSEPYSTLVQATNGDFYGTTYLGGAHNYGSIFSITSTGSLTTLYNFCSQTNCTDGIYPNGSLLQASDGIFYGTTNQGGITEKCPWLCPDDSAGTIFKLDLGLPSTLPTGAR
jgi:uncharacterized repeat protein (TIGR03803 family)